MAATYYSRILNGFYWENIVRTAKAEPQEDFDNPGTMKGYCFLGTVFSIMPSGKFYTPWTTNQTRQDEIKDEAYMEALERAAEKYGGWIESGEGDPCDLFFVMSIETEKETEEE